MPLGIGVGRIVGLVQETRRLEGASPRIDVSGPGAAELALALSAGGDPGAVSVGGDPLRAAVAIRLVDGEPSVTETGTLRQLTRAGTPVIVVRLGGERRIPHVIPGDVVDADVGAEVPVAELATAISRVVGPEAPALAARLPVLRAAVARRLIVTTSLANAALAASSKLKEAQLPLLTLAQGRMLLLLGVSRGNLLPREPQELARAAGPAVVGSLGMGFGARAVVRRLPVSGPLVRATVAFAGTWALGAARLRR